MKIKKIFYTSKFEKNFTRLPLRIKRLAARKQKIFQINPFDSSLVTHKLTGRLGRKYSFSVNYSYRIVFIFENEDEVTFLDIGTHSIYQ